MKSTPTLKLTQKELALFFLAACKFSEDQSQPKALRLEAKKFSKWLVRKMLLSPFTSRQLNDFERELRIQAFKEALEIAKDYDRWCICHNKCSDIEGCSKNLADEIQEKINELEAVK